MCVRAHRDEYTPPGKCRWVGVENAEKKEKCPTYLERKQCRDEKCTWSNKDSPVSTCPRLLIVKNTT